MSGLTPQGILQSSSVLAAFQNLKILQNIVFVKEPQTVSIAIETTKPMQAGDVALGGSPRLLDEGLLVLLSLSRNRLTLPWKAHNHNYTVTTINSAHDDDKNKVKEYQLTHARNQQASGCTTRKTMRYGGHALLLITYSKSLRAWLPKRRLLPVPKILLLRLEQTSGQVVP